jgi:hypothetical protein
MGEKRTAYGVLVKSEKGRDHQEDLDVGGSIILKWILGKHDGVL